MNLTIIVSLLSHICVVTAWIIKHKVRILKNVTKALRVAAIIAQFQTWTARWYCSARGIFLLIFARFDGTSGVPCTASDIPLETSQGFCHRQDFPEPYQSLFRVGPLHLNLLFSFVLLLHRSPMGFLHSSPVEPPPPPAAAAAASTVPPPIASLVADLYLASFPCSPWKKNSHSSGFCRLFIKWLIS